MSDARRDDVIRTTANRLYWNSADTVNEIAARLQIPRGVLYSAVQPVPAGTLCPECGGGMYFANRSARSANRGVCSVCGATHDTSAVGEDAPPPAPAVAAGYAPPSEFAQRAVTLGAGALLGVALGATIGAAIRR